jgi:hypothetical protein
MQVGLRQRKREYVEVWMSFFFRNAHDKLLSVVVDICNPSYSGGGDQEDWDLRPALDPIQKNK